MKTICGLCLTTLAIVGVMSMAAGCLGGENSGTTADEATLRAGGVSFSRHPNPGTGGTSMVPPTPAGTGGSPAAPPPSDVQALIAAAQTPDGAAIPQPAGPNGVCPPVVVALGFWSCPQLGQTCSYTSGGTSHACTCDRQDGEGGFPDWICDP